MLSLDLEEITAGWDCPPGEMAARLVRGRDGQDLVQLRVDLGVLQMHPDGRPDGEFYHGLPMVLDYLQHEFRVGRDAISHEHWQALDREVSQLNFRRMALASVAEDALRRQDEDAAESYIVRVLRDIDLCQAALRLPENGGVRSAQAHLWPTLVFNRARLLCQLRVIERDYDNAIEVAEAGADELRALLVEQGILEAAGDDEPEDIGVVYLTELSRQLRVQYEVELTLREQFEVALEEEDYELAAELDGEMKAREAERQARAHKLDISPAE